MLKAIAWSCPLRYRQAGGGVVAMPGLIEAPTHIWVAVAPVDMRRGLDGLSAII